MTKMDKDIQADMNKPRPVFLVGAAVCAGLAFFTYFLEDSIVADDGQGALTFAFILICLVFAAMFLMLCYRNPHLGNKLLGYHAVSGQEGPKAKSDVQYSAGFKSESGMDVKLRSSARKQARHSRKKLAEITRQMQAEKQQNTNTE